MAKYNLLVLSVVLLVCSTIFPERISDLSIDATVVRNDEDTVEMAPVAGPSGAGVILRSYNGCSYNQKPHDNDSIFCCEKDQVCWPSLQVCMPNCPCTANCGKRKGLSSSEADMTPLVQD